MTLACPFSCGAGWAQVDVSSVFEDMSPRRADLIRHETDVRVPPFFTGPFRGLNEQGCRLEFDGAFVESPSVRHGGLLDRSRGSSDTAARKGQPY